MDIFKEFQLFLFDFDGLLVNTEEIHYQAYIRMCSNRGYELNWSFPYYCSMAHYNADGLREQLYLQFPKLKAEEPNWPVLYQEKKKAFLELIREGAVQLMPGAESLLSQLQRLGSKRCVVTHSPAEFIQAIRLQNPILDSIPNWITREHYSQPKPNSECYLKAIQLFAEAHEKVIGFEDTPRGLQALMGTRAFPVLICQTDYPEIPSLIEKGVSHFTSLEKVLLLS